MSPNYNNDLIEGHLLQISGIFFQGMHIYPQNYPQAVLVLLTPEHLHLPTQLLRSLPGFGADLHYIHGLRLYNRIAAEAELQ